MLGKKIENRRRGPDPLTKAIGIFAGISWILVILVLILKTYAKPRMATMFDKSYGISISQTSDASMLMYANIVLVLVFTVCLIGMMINMSRHKRKSDRFRVSLIFFGLGSLIWLVINLVSN
jgi:hypothetical protein